MTRPRLHERIVKAKMRRDYQEPMSVSAMAEHVDGGPPEGVSRHNWRPSGQTRAQLEGMLDGALKAIYAAAEAKHGAESFEAAAVILKLVSRDETFVPPAWLKAKFAAHVRALSAEFASNPPTPPPQTDPYARDDQPSWTRKEAV